jgi:hypothetical protein
MGTGKTKAYHNSIVLNQRAKEERYKHDMEAGGDTDVEFYPTLILILVSSNVEESLGRKHILNIS